MKKGRSFNKVFAVILCIAVLFTFTACGSKGSNANSGNDVKTDKVLTLGFTSMPVNLNTLERNDDPIFDLIYPGICQFDDDGTMHKNLAESITASEGGQVYTVKLRKTGWSDGKPLTADDVMFTIKNICNPKAAAVATSRFTIFKGTDDKGFSAAADGSVSGAEKIDDSTIKFSCKYPVNEYVFYDAMMFLRPQPMHILKDVPIEQFQTNSLFQTANVTSGPYKATKYEKNQYMELVRNDAYYAKPKIDKFLCKVVDAANLVAQLKTGEVDMNILSLGYSDIKLVQSFDNVNLVIPKPMPVFRYLIINCKTLNNAKLRQAIAYAIDRQAMVQAILYGAGAPSSGPYNTDHLFYDAKYQASYDLAKAKALLAESGWDKSKPIKLRASSRSAATQQMGEMTNTYLTALGLKIDFQLSDHATMLASTRKGDYDISVIGYGWTPFEPNVSVFFGTGGSFNLSQYSNPKMDELLQAGLREVDTAKRKAIYSDLQALYMQEMPITFLFGEQWVYAYNKRVLNYTPHAYGIFNSVVEWDIAAAK